MFKKYHEFDCQIDAYYYWKTTKADDLNRILPENKANGMGAFGGGGGEE